MSEDPREMDGPVPAELEAALRELPREREPGELLEERTVRAVRAAGVLQPAGAPGPAGGDGHLGSRPGWHGGSFRVPASWWAAGVAASLALFAGGVVTGQWLGGRQAADMLAAQQQATMQEMSALVEQTGSAYVNALSRLAESNAGAGTAGQSAAHEAALQILHQAANEVVRMAPDDPVAAKILQGFDHAALQQAPADGERSRRIMWF